MTPNGLDAADTGGKHATTAAELAGIMSYCIKKSPQRELFLQITRMQNYKFEDVDGKRNFSCSNHNAFLSMMEGALTGKTGFTGDAGYCYVGAVERDGRTFVAALLACGWPNNKGYKWSDTKKLMNYGIENYEYRDVFQNQDFPKLAVEKGIPENGGLFETAVTGVKLKAGKEDESIPLLLRKDEKAVVETDLREELKAPVQAGEEVGTVTYRLGDEIVKQYPVVAVQTVREKNIGWYFRKITDRYLLR